MPTTRQRKVRGLRWAQLQKNSPFAPTKPRASALRRGLAFEKNVGRHLLRLMDSGELVGDLRLGQWIVFSDDFGVSHAQPDAYLLTTHLVLLMECKLTQSDAAEDQMRLLYVPLLKHLYELPVVCLQVCKNLRYIPQRLVDGPEALLDKARSKMHTWHFYD